MSSFRKKERQSTPDLTCGTDERVKILGNSCINGIERNRNKNESKVLCNGTPEEDNNQVKNVSITPKDNTT